MLFIGLVVFAQIPKNEVDVDITVFRKEKPALIINSNILLAGESLLYEIAILNDSNIKSTLSKIAYVTLQNENDSIVFSHKLKLDRGVAYGDFFIPSTLKTGTYRLFGYTNFSRNNTVDAFNLKYVYVINTFLKDVYSPKLTDTIRLNAISERDFDFSGKKDNDQILKINTDKQIYGFRDKVALAIENILEENKGNYVLSVRKINPVKIPNRADEPIKNDFSETFYIPELRGEIISGVVLSHSDNNPAANKVVSLTIPGKDFVFKMAKTNKNGRFSISVSEEYNSENCIIQLIEPSQSTENYSLKLDSKQFILNKVNPSILKLDPNLKSWLQDRSVQIQIENAYYDEKRDSILTVNPHQPFFDNLGTVYNLDDYTRFNSVRETLIEIIKLAAIRGSDENSRFLVYNDYDPNGLGKFNDIPPLVLVDGMLIQNNNELIGYNANQISSIRVIKEPYRYGPNLYSGIISVKTKNNDFVPTLSSNVEAMKIQPKIRKKKYFSPNYVNAKKLSRIPDYRVQLLWQPKLELSSENYSNSFFTSDVPGIYEIRLEGFSDLGPPKIIRSYFEVREN